MTDQPPLQVLQIPEILELIFHNLTPLDLLGSCRGVCRVWRDIIATSWLVRHYAVTGLHSDELLSSTIQLTPAATSILSSFWLKVGYLNCARGMHEPENREEFVQKLYEIYASFQYPLKTVSLFKPRPTQPNNLDYYKTRVQERRTSPYYHGIREFEKLFSEENELLLQDQYPNVHIARALCQMAMFFDFRGFAGYPDQWDPLQVGDFVSPQRVCLDVEFPTVTGDKLGEGKRIRREGREVIVQKQVAHVDVLFHFGGRVSM
ncbi:hypothetical protein TWF694_005384 [Orbilia ellipsospora]|uniref:F-box domain-containing protein n=1 Tax=Orbilia ellipsospora TaxID=2528407 RepID=A0AAV9WSZ7_9PEZI